MNNFEKWRDSLTPEFFVKTGLCFLSCKDCPASSPCDISDDDLECGDFWREWANAEADEEENKNAT